MENKKTVMRSVMRTGKAWINHMKEIASSYGIPDSYRHVIMMLVRKPGASQRAIAEFAEVTTSAVNQTVKSMIEEGYICKKTDDCDKRQSKLFLTEKGEETAEKLRERLAHSDGVITSLITSEKEAEIIALLDKIAECIQRDLSC